MKTVNVLFTGPESSGKSTLAHWAANRWGGTYVPEYARLHIQNLDFPYVLDDLLFIANQQLKLEEMAQAKGGFVFYDTSLLVIHIWMMEKYGVSLWDHGFDPGHLESFDLICLCRPDFPWVVDFQRENPHDRDRLFKIYERYLIDNALPYASLEGPQLDRTMRVEALMKF